MKSEEGGAMGDIGRTDHGVLVMLGSRIAEHRLQKNLTQSELAKEAGVSKPTLERLERGNSVQMTNLIRVLRALGMIEHLDLLVPELPPSPLQQLKSQRGKRQRASSKSKTDSPYQVKDVDNVWNWDDQT
jgi:putative transcriptional regulator